MLWTEIPGFSDYLISTNKEVMNKATGRILTPRIKKGYRQTSVDIIKDNAARRECGRRLHTNVSVSRIFNEVYPFHWFNQLADDEMVKPLVFDVIPEGLYYITSYGRVYSTAYHQFSKKQPLDKYYHTVPLRHKARKDIIVHTMVGRLFLPDYKPGLWILHKDETLPPDEIDNVNNLWCGTRQDNMTDMVNKGRQKKKKGA